MRCGHNLMSFAHKVSNQHHLANLIKQIHDVLVRLGNRLDCTGKRRNSQEKLQVGDDILPVAYAFLHCSAASSNNQSLQCKYYVATPEHMWSVATKRTRN
jgi:hypothetical protein